MISGNEFLDELLKGAKSDNLVSADDKQKKLLNTLGLVRSKTQPQDLHNDQASQILNDLFSSNDSKSLKKLPSNEEDSIRSEYQISSNNIDRLSANASGDSTEDIDALKSEMKQIRMGLKELRQFMMQSPVKAKPPSSLIKTSSADLVEPDKLRSELLDSSEQLHHYRRRAMRAFAILQRPPF